MENHISVGRYSQIQDSFIGEGSYISEYCVLQHTKIGKYCSIADNVRCGIGSHPTNIFVSTHPAFFSTTKQAGFTFVHKNSFDELPKVKNSDYVVEIGNDVWIGSGVKIIDGIKIGDGAIIGANAVVTKDVHPYSINVGIPSRPIKYRFCQDDIAFLIQFKWWNKEYNWIKQNASLFSDIKIFRKMTQDYDK